jgi:hypothetical protein
MGWQDIIRSTNLPTVSHICNGAKKALNIFQEYGFWEMRDGKMALFWDCFGTTLGTSKNF